MPHRNPKPQSKKEQEEKKEAHRRREQFLGRSARIRHILALKETIDTQGYELQRLVLNFSTLTDLLDKKRSILGFKFLPKKKFQKALLENLDKVRADLETKRHGEGKGE